MQEDLHSLGPTAGQVRENSPLGVEVVLRDW